MAEALHLIGFKHSVYTWIVRLGLREMGMDADYSEANPFAEDPDPILARYTPLRRVPVLEHGGVVLTETAAILRYLDHISDAPALVPSEAKAAAQMGQVIGLVDADVYPVMVSKVFSQGFYLPHVQGTPGDIAILSDAFKEAVPVLSLLEQIAEDGRVLNAQRLSLADLHLGPMMSYFTRVPEGRAVLGGYPALSRWWDWMRGNSSLRATDPLP